MVSQHAPSRPAYAQHFGRIRIEQVMLDAITRPSECNDDRVIKLVIVRGFFQLRVCFVQLNSFTASFGAPSGCCLAVYSSRSTRSDAL